MESQTRFDLTRAIDNWRAELSSLPRLTSDSTRELETHLRDTITGFQQRGLNDEESFWLARRRVGPPEQLVMEFAKADPAAVWRERLFWLACGLLFFRLVSMLVNSFWEPLFIGGLAYHHTLAELLPQWVAFYLPAWVNGIRYPMYLQFLPGIINLLLIPGLLVLATRIQGGKLQSRLSTLLQDRGQFFMGFMVLTLFATIAAVSISNLLAHRAFSDGVTARWAYWLLDTVPLVAIATWLLPGNKQKTA